MAQRYGGDPASADWRHVGRLAGFINQKPSRRSLRGYGPWVKIVYARAGLAPHANALVHSAMLRWRPLWLSCDASDPIPSNSGSTTQNLASATTAEASAIYTDCMKRWRIAERFPQPDWSIVDLWVARHLLSQGMPAPQVESIL